MRLVVRKSTQLAAIVVLFVALTAANCGTTPYKTAAGIQTGVELAMNTYGEMVRSDMVPVATQNKVRTLYTSYQYVATATVVVLKQITALELVQNPTPAQKQELVDKRASLAASMVQLDLVSANLLSVLAELNGTKPLVK